MAWISQGTDNETGLPLWFNSDTGEMKYGQYGSQLSPDAYDANGTMIATGWNPNMAFPTDQGGYSVRQLSSSYLANGGDPNDQAAFERYMRASYPLYKGPLNPDAIVPPSAMPESAGEFPAFLAMLAPPIAGMVGLAGAAGAAGAAELGAGGAMDMFGSLASPTLGNAGGTIFESGATGSLLGGANGMSINLDDFYSMLDEIQSSTNGVTAPSPTMSVPGYGDIYGSMESIIKNAGNIPGLSSLLKGASGNSALSALKNLLSGNGSSGDIFSALGGLAPLLLGMYASNQQTNAMKDLAGKYAEYGAPYRQQLADITADPSKFYNSTAAQQGVNTVLNKLSIGGNPSGSPYKQQLAVDSLWNDYGKERDRLAGFGGLTNYNAAAPSLDAQAVNSQGNMYNALGAGLNDIFNPKTSLADLLKQGKIA